MAAILSFKHFNRLGKTARKHEILSSILEVIGLTLVHQVSTIKVDMV